MLIHTNYHLNITFFSDKPMTTTIDSYVNEKSLDRYDFYEIEFGIRIIEQSFYTQTCGSITHTSVIYQDYCVDL